MQNLANLSLKDLVDAFSGATGVARDAMPTRDQVLRALGGKPADDMMGSFGIFAAGIVLGAGARGALRPEAGVGDPRSDRREDQQHPFGRRGLNVTL